MKISIQTFVLTLLVLGGCDRAATRGEPIPIVLQPEKGESVTLNIPRGYVEEPKNLKGPIPNAVLRISEKDFGAPGVLVAESEVRIAMEPNASDADAGEGRHAAALRKHRSSVEALKKSKERSKKGLIAYSYPNGEEPDAEAYFLDSKSGDVFVDCRRSVCKAYKTWNKRVHMRFDFRPVETVNVAAIDTAVDRMMQSFTQSNSTETGATTTNK